MDSTNSILINRFFTRNTFNQIIADGNSSAYSAVIRRYINDPDTMTNSECISEIYQYLRANYQNEYYYKNTLLNKLLLGVHSPRTTSALTELPIGRSKADFILINGKAVVYEIKTELDNFDRLESQISDYYTAFSRVVLVTSEEHYQDANLLLKDSPVGIYVLTHRGTISLRKKPIEYKEHLNHTTMFKILRKKEYERILLSEYGKLPSVSQFEYFHACQEWFESIDSNRAYSLFTQELKTRVHIDIEEYSQIPYELKSLAYFSNYRKADFIKLNTFLNSRKEPNVLSNT